MNNDDYINAVFRMIMIYFLINFVFGLLNYGRLYYRFKKANSRNNQTWKKAAKAFGVRAGKLKKMSKDEIKNRYREMAKKVHPDHGGNSEEFRKVHEAYKFVYDQAA